MRTSKNLVLFSLIFAVLAMSEASSAASPQCAALFSEGKSDSKTKPAKKPGKPKDSNAPAKPAKSLKSGAYIMTAKDLAAANIQDERAATKKKVDAYEEALAEHKIQLIKHIEWVEKTLKTRYEGWDDQITRMMSSIKSMALRNDSNDNLSGPLVIPLMTFPGYGKTSIVMDLVTLMAEHPDFAYLKAVFDRVAIKEDSAWLDLNLMSEAGTTRIDRTRPISRIIFYDEIQNLLSLENLKKIKSMYTVQKHFDDAGKLVREDRIPTPEQTAAIEKIRHAMGLASGALNIDYIIEKRQQMINSIWSIYGNGRAPRLRKQPLSYYENLIQTNLVNYETGVLLFKTTQERKARWQQLYVERNLDLEAKVERLAKDKENKDLVAEMQAATNLLSEAKTGLATDEHSLYVWSEQGINSSSSPVGVKDFVNKFIKLLSDDYPNLVHDLGYENAEGYFNEFWDDPAAARAHLSAVIAAAPKDLLQDYRRMIVFIAGNPTPMLDDVMLRAQVDPRSLDPDSLYRLSKSTSQRLTKKFFEDIFGKAEAMKSRLKMDEWSLIAPFTSNQWNKMVHRRLQATHDVFHETLQKVTYPAGMDIDLKLDDTVADFLRERGVSAIGGPRVFMKNVEGYLGILESNLPLALMNLPKDHHAWKSNQYEVVRELTANENLPAADSEQYSYTKVVIKGKNLLVKKWRTVTLQVSYRAATNSFKVSEAEIAGKPSKDALEMELSLGEKIEQTKSAVEVSKSAPSLSRVRNAYFQAARAVVGMSKFHTAPTLITDGNTTADHALPEMWSVTNNESLDYWILEAQSLLAGLVIEKTQPQLARNKQSDLSKTEVVILATSVLDKIAEELVDRDRYSSFLHEVEQEHGDLSDILPKDLASSAVMDYAFDIDLKNLSEKNDPASALLAPNKRKILHLLYRQVEQILKDKSKAVDAIAAHLLEKGPIESETTKSLVANYFTKGPKIWNFWMTPKGAATKKAILTAQAGDAFVLQTPSAGQFDYKPVKHSLWSTLTQMFRAD